jgi:hypothetical protein
MYVEAWIELITDIFKTENFTSVDKLTVSMNYPHELLEFRILNKCTNYDTCVIPFKFLAHIATFKNLDIKCKDYNIIEKNFFIEYGNLLGMKIYLVNLDVDAIFFGLDGFIDVNTCLSVAEMVTPMKQAINIQYYHNFNQCGYMELKVNNLAVERKLKLASIQT